MSTLPPSASDRRLALGVVLASAAFFVALVPFLDFQLAAVPAFVPAHSAALAVIDLIIAALVCRKFRILGRRRLLVLASAYFFASLIAVAQVLTFPGAVTPKGLFDAGPQGSAWLYVFGHCGLAMFFFAYAVPDGEAGTTGRPDLPVILAWAAIALAVAVGLTSLSSAGRDHAPGMGLSAALMGMTDLLAMAALWRRRTRSVLDLWLLVVMSAWILEAGLSAAFGGGQYDLGWYAGHAYGLVAAAFVLAILLVESSTTYAKLEQKLGGERMAHSRESLERQRAESSALEVRQRLDGIIDSAMDAIITVDETQDIVLFNTTAEALFGCPRGEALGQPLAQFIPERFRRGHYAHIERFGESEHGSRRMSAQRVVTGLRRNGEEFPIDASISQATLHGRRFYTVILRDVTERVRAEEALQRSKDDLHEMATASATAREHEKTRIARELHDELGQSLTALKMDFAWLKEHGHGGHPAYSSRVQSMEKILEGMVTSTRRISADLRPLMLDDLGLVPAVEWLVDSFQVHHGIACGLSIDPPELDLDDPHATAVFRILQESLTNIAKHAQATRVDVALACADGHFVVRVRDNGCGFDAASPRKSGSFGLVGLRERAYLVDGRIAVDSAPGKGTSIEVRIPLPGAAV